MAGSGIQKYPGASLAHWYQTKYGGDAMDVNTVVLHTTEGRTLPDYDGGAIAPNLTAVPDIAARKLNWYQHFDIDTSARALRNLVGGVETNTLNVCQVELVGTCDPATHKGWLPSSHIYWPEAPDWALADVAEFLAWMHAQHGVPLSGPAKWPAYPASYGASNGARMSNAAWTKFSGVCGHLHVPENLHGDPGAIDFARLIALAQGTTQEDDVALTDADKDDIATRVVARLLAGEGALENSDITRIWSADIIPAARPPYNNPDYYAADGTTLANTTWPPKYAAQVTVEGVRQALALLGEIKAALASPQPITLTDAQVQAIAATPGLADAIAERVAVKLAARLAS